MKIPYEVTAALESKASKFPGRYIKEIRSNWELLKKVKNGHYWLSKFNKLLRDIDNIGGYSSLERHLFELKVMKFLLQLNCEALEYKPITKSINKKSVDLVFESGGHSYLLELKMFRPSQGKIELNDERIADHNIYISDSSSAHEELSVYGHLSFGFFHSNNSHFQ